MEESLIKRYGKLAKCSIVCADTPEYCFGVILPCCSIQDYLELNPTHQLTIHCLVDYPESINLV